MNANRTRQPIDRQNPEYSRILLSVGAAWVVTLGFDLFLHAGLLSKLYLEPGPFLLEPQEAFRRIPFGYLAFLIITLALYWLFRRLGVRGAGPGFRWGATAGAVVWGAFLVGLYSISTAPLELLAAWWIGQSVELGLAGALLGAAADRVPLKRIWVLAGIVVVSCVAVTVLLQSLGWAPPMKVVR